MGDASIANERLTGGGPVHPVRPRAHAGDRVAAGHGGAAGYVGRRIRRLEDPPLVTGRGTYLDDVAVPGALHATFVRSDIPHGLIRSIDASEAVAAGAIVITAADLGPTNGPHLHPKWLAPSRSLVEASEMRFREATIELLAAERVRFVGEAIAAVLAPDPYRARDAAALVSVDVESLEPVPDAEAALAPAAPRLYPDWDDNVAASFRLRLGSWEMARAAADVCVAGRYHSARASAAPIEPRGMVAIPKLGGQGLLVHTGNQIPPGFRDAIAKITGLPREAVVVRTLETGGGFGLKGMLYPEELAVAVIAMQLGRPVRWVATRREDLLSAAHARDQVHDLELALNRDGRILGLRDRFVLDAGACNALGLTVPYNTASHVRGPYRIPAAEIEGLVAVTNRSPTAAYRGAGRPEAVFALERALDRAAGAIGMDPAELRRRNLLREDELPLDAAIPYRDGVGLVMDIGAPGPCLEEALELIDQAAFRQAQAAARAEGRLLGLGVAAYVEGTGIGPAEQAIVSMDRDGRASVTIAPSTQGQGQRTTMAQLAADRLGIAPEDVTVHQGDTALLGEGGGAIASRTLVVAGNAVADASDRLRARLLDAAADLLEASAGDIAIAGGRVGVVGSEPAVPIGDVVRHLLAAARPGGDAVPADEPGEPGPGMVEERGRFAPATVTFAHGVHAVTVEVDRLTGGVTILRYVVVHDCGRIVNPLIVDGQVAGGVAQGAGAALSEALIYGDDGQLLTATLADYRLPRSTDLPDIEMVHRETPSTRNPLGVKGVGEAGIIAAPVAVLNAVADAVGPAGDALQACPVTAEEIRRLIARDEPSGGR